MIISKIYLAFSNLMVAIVMASSLLGVIILSDRVTYDFYSKVISIIISLIFVSVVRLICLLFVSVVSFQA